MILSSNLVESKTYIALGLVDPSGKEISSPPRVLSILSSVLERSLERNEYLSKGSEKKNVVTIFHSSKAPTLSIRQYIERIFKYASCSPSCFVVAFIYLDRFLQRTNASLTSLNVHRLLMTSVLVAVKFVDDECHSNAYFAKIGGISTAEMNKLELNFLFILDFKLYVTTELFAKYCSELAKEATDECRIKPMTRVSGTRAGWANKVGDLLASYRCRVS